VDFLVDASMPRGTAALIHSRAHNATDVRDIGMGGAPDQDIAAYAQAHQMAILSRDFDFADVRNYPPNQYLGLVVIDLPSTATAPTILKLVETLSRIHKRFRTCLVDLQSSSQVETASGLHRERASFL